MTTKAYSFAAQSNITILTQAQLTELVDERRARGCSEAELSHFEHWHQARLGL
jgi:hypothetical protein